MSYMIASKTRTVPRGPYVYSYLGKSTDTKPTDDGVGTGSDFYEIDTQKVFMYDADMKTWIEQ